jgi:hypothetical protein
LEFSPSFDIWCYWTLPSSLSAFFFKLLFSSVKDLVVHLFHGLLLPFNSSTDFASLLGSPIFVASSPLYLNLQPLTYNFL